MFLCYCTIKTLPYQYLNDRRPAGKSIVAEAAAAASLAPVTALVDLAGNFLHLGACLEGRLNGLFGPNTQAFIRFMEPQAASRRVKWPSSRGSPVL